MKTASLAPATSAALTHKDKELAGVAGILGAGPEAGSERVRQRATG
jgi:hypothetical protein